jgi:N-acetyl-anhydromuramyl-L-alanine amidase AmpD
MDFTRLVRNRSSRNGSRPRLMVLHTTEGDNHPGIRDLEGLAGWFDNPDAQASSHVGIDAEGNCVRMVPDTEKAWTQGNHNPFCLSIEQVGHASFTRRFWMLRYRRGHNRVAKQLGEWSIKYDIPLEHSTSHGVCEHVDISGPGGHTDCGPGYPLQYVLWRAGRHKLLMTGGRPALAQHFLDLINAAIRRAERA